MLRGEALNDLPFMVRVNGAHAHFVGHFIQIGMGEMGGVIVVHAAFAAPLDDGTFNGALARIFILISMTMPSSFFFRERK